VPGENLERVRGYKGSASRARTFDEVVKHALANEQDKCGGNNSKKVVSRVERWRGCSLTGELSSVLWVF